MERDRPVLVIDLRGSSLAADRAALERGAPAPPLPSDEPIEAEEAIDTVAILHDGSDEPFLLAIEPTRDRRWLDALARLVRFAVLRGERIPEAAIRYGGEYERRLVFRLPDWARDGVGPERARALPPALRRVLSR